MCAKPHISDFAEWIEEPFFRTSLKTGILSDCRLRLSCRRFSPLIQTDTSNLLWDFLKEPCLALKRCDVAADPILATNPLAASLRCCICIFNRSEWEEEVWRWRGNEKKPAALSPLILYAHVYRRVSLRLPVEGWRWDSQWALIFFFSATQPCCVQSRWHNQLMNMLSAEDRRIGENWWHARRQDTQQRASVHIWSVFVLADGRLKSSVAPRCIFFGF